MKEKIKKTVLGTMTYDEYADLMVALSHKDFLSVYEASVYFGVGVNRLYGLVKQSDFDFIVPNGKTRLISRERFKKYMMDGNLKKE